MGELVFVAVFNTHTYEKELTKRQKFKKTKQFQTAKRNR